MAANERTAVEQASSRFGHHVSILTFAALTDGGTYATPTSVIKQYQNVGVSIEVETANVRSVMDSWDFNVTISRRVTLDFSRCVEGILGLLQMAASNAAFQAVIEVGGTGSTKITGNFVFTRAQWQSPDGPQVESLTAVSQGPITVTDGT